MGQCIHLWNADRGGFDVHVVEAYMDLMNACYPNALGNTSANDLVTAANGIVCSEQDKRSKSLFHIVRECGSTEAGRLAVVVRNVAGWPLLHVGEMFITPHGNDLMAREHERLLRNLDTLLIALAKGGVYETSRSSHSVDFYGLPEEIYVYLMLTASRFARPIVSIPMLCNLYTRAANREKRNVVRATCTESMTEQRMLRLIARNLKEKRGVFFGMKNVEQLN